MLIRGAEIAPGRRADVRLAQRRVTQVARVLRPRRGERTVDGSGCTLLPGLHDHHLHLLALAAARASVSCGPPDIASTEALRSALANAAGSGAMIRGVGYHESLGPDIDRYWLDSVCGRTPVRVQHRSGRLWILNSAALARLPTGVPWPAGAERDTQGRPTGRFYHLDDWLRTQLGTSAPSLAPVSRQLAQYGVTGVTDAGPENDADVLALMQRAQDLGELRQRVLLMGNATLPYRRGPRLATGAHKIYLKESRLPDFDELCAAITASHQRARPTAFHCVTRTELQVALSALAQTGVLPGDRIEHASIADDAALTQLAALGLTVVTQPNFVFERGDHYLRQVEAADFDVLYRGRSFLRAGVALAAGTDAPFGDPDPWRAIRAAVQRTTRSGQRMGGDEALTPQRALMLFTGDCRSPGRRLRRIAAGSAADLCLARGDWRDVAADPDRQRVIMTVCDGEVIWEAQTD